ncbi:hypothetical protein IV203_000634 [Nitzschia inconspicua]|uniref:Uncharacterized protein n=1 Tax=Nitzschia inconspicua TaxID=303405 RepID=A0A9K3PQU8_9STRA|nr:hypothetical protein IV203_000634 [Nitzschia inconspicua]
MSGNIPYAQPFPWNSPSLEAAQQLSTTSLRKRKFVGTGRAFLLEESFGSKSKMGKTAKRILKTLLHQHGTELPAVSESVKAMKSTPRSQKVLKFQKRGEPHPGTSDEEILRNASEGKYSLFKSILRIIESETGVVHTKEFLGKACLVVDPSTMPGHMDAKDMVLAALHFLSTTYKPKSQDLLELPLIRAAQVYSDLEKRNYLKAGTWKLNEVEDKILKMEELFLTSPRHWKWLKRDTFCPRLTWEEESLFYRKGAVPPRAEPKRKGEIRRRSKNSASNPTSPTPSAVRSGTPTPSLLAEASIDGTATSVDDEDDDGPVVEAMILDDDED